MKGPGTCLVPTVLAGYTVAWVARAGAHPLAVAAKGMAIGSGMQQSFRLAFAGGVRIALGTDAGVMRHGTNAREFELMVRYGMPPMQAIQAGTLVGATLLGREADVGSLDRKSVV